MLVEATSGGSKIIARSAKIADISRSDQQNGSTPVRPRLERRDRQNNLQRIGATFKIILVKYHVSCYLTNTRHPRREFLVDEGQLSQPRDRDHRRRRRGEEAGKSQVRTATNICHLCAVFLIQAQPVSSLTPSKSFSPFDPVRNMQPLQTTPAAQFCIAMSFLFL